MLYSITESPVLNSKENNVWIFFGNSVGLFVKIRVYINNR